MRAAIAALMANTIYFVLAAAATIYLTAEAWHYGFWFTPFPLLLTVIALVFVGASGIGIFYLRRRWWQLIGLVGAFSLWSFAAVAGSFLCSGLAVRSTMSYFIPIVFVQLAAMFLLLQRCNNAEPVSALSRPFAKAVRLFALLMPLPVMALAVLSMYANAHIDGKHGDVTANKAFVDSQRFLFGLKRADELLQRRIYESFSHNHYGYAEEYARLAVLNAERRSFFSSDKQAQDRRLARNVQTLWYIYGLEGKTIQ